MGVIDSTHYLLNCPVCFAQDAPRAVERGSVYGGGYWTGPESEKFVLHLKHLPTGESVIEAATCKCGGTATVVMK